MIGMMISVDKLLQPVQHNELNLRLDIVDGRVAHSEDDQRCTVLGKIHPLQNWQRDIETNDENLHNHCAHSDNHERGLDVRIHACDPVLRSHR